VFFTVELENVLFIFVFLTKNIYIFTAEKKPLPVIVLLVLFYLCKKLKGAVPRDEFGF